MRRRDLLLSVLAVELVAGVALLRGGWLSLAPVVPAVPPSPTVVAEPPTPPQPSTRVSAVDVRRGDTLVRALRRQGSNVRRAPASPPRCRAMAATSSTASTVSNRLRRRISYPL